MRKVTPVDLMVAACIGAQNTALLTLHATELLVREINEREAQALSAARGAVAEAIASCDAVLARLSEEGVLS